MIKKRYYYNYHRKYNSKRDISLKTIKDEIILIDSLQFKYRPVNCLSISRSLKRLYFFTKVLSFKYILLSSLDGDIWRIKIILWEASYFRYLNNIQGATWNCNTWNVHWKNIQWKYKKKKEKKLKPRNLFIVYTKQCDRFPN